MGQKHVINPVGNTNDWQGTITINIERANLKESFFKPNPYCLFEICENEKQLCRGKTRKVSSTLNPKWGVRFTRQIKGSGPINIIFDIYDKDALGKQGDLLGHFVHTLTPRPYLEETQIGTLTDKHGGTKTNRGSLTF